MSPRALMPNARVAVAPAKSIVVYPEADMRNPCVPLAFWNTPTMSPRAFTSHAAVDVLPGIRNGVKIRSFDVVTLAPVACVHVRVQAYNAPFVRRSAVVHRISWRKQSSDLAGATSSRR